jgi:hypothetical protein
MNMARTRWTLAVATTVLIAACGGGAGSSGTPSAGTGSTKTMLVTGAISGFGSVIVNGVHYETDSASVTLEGHSGTVAQLKVGEVVHLKATIDAQGKPHATTIDQQRLIQGVVQAVDVAAGTLTIAGQLIKTDNATMFDPSIPGGTLAGITIGNRVEVHGFVSASGDALATRIEMAAAGDHEIEVTGPLSALDTAAHRFTVGAQVVDYSTATLEGFAASGPVEGDIVEAKGTTLLPDGALKAAKVHKEDGGLDGHPGDGGELEGLVTRFVSPTDFDVAGQKVTTTGTTVYVGGTSADLKMDTRVEVDGKLDASGTLVADKVAIRHQSSLKLSAPVEAVAVDGLGGTVQALGVTFIVTADTRKEDHQTDNHFFSLADVHVGDWVEMSGYPDPAGTGKMIATKLERHGPEGQVELRGPSDQLATPSFKIAGVDIATTPSTVFEDGHATIAATDFFAKPAGLIVDVAGSWTTPSLLATRVQIEHEDSGSEPPPPMPH